MSVGMATRATRPHVFDEPAHLKKERDITDALFANLPDVNGMEVVDLACGWGGMGLKFLARGANLTFVDGRRANLDIVRERLASVPGGNRRDVFQADITELKLSNYDLALCLGVLYHVGNPLKLLERVATCAPILAVESICLDHDGVFLVNLQEDTNQRDYSLTGDACRPSPGWIESALERVGFHDIVDLSSQVPNTLFTNGWAGQLYDWEFQRTCGWRRDDCHLRKLYLARK